MPDSQMARVLPSSLSKTVWTMLLPWLDDYRSGPPILSSDELIPNAWLDSSPAKNLNEANFRRFCELVAARHLKDRADVTLADDFPTLPTTSPVAALDLDVRSAKALHDNGFTTCEDALAQSATSLLSLPRIGRATVIDLLTAFVAEATHSRHCGGHSDTRVLADPGLLDFISSIDARDRVILDDRIFAVHPRTQTELAKKLGLSRERVNQLDRDLRVQLSEMISGSVDLRRLLAETVAVADPVADSARVAQILPLFATTIPALGVSVGQILITGSDELDRVDEWIISRSPVQIADHVGRILDANTGDEALVPLSAVATGLKMPAPEAARWLGRGGFTVLEDQVINGPTTTGDLICAVLSIAGTPCTFDEIVTGLAGEPRSRSSVRNALVTDDRIVKTDRTTYGLRRWGGQQYLPVHRQIGHLLDAAGGRIDIADLISQISEKYDVTESSIRAYAGAGEFVTREDVVTRRSETYVHRKSPAKTRFLYRDGATIRWATTIGAAHLKGSAFNIPSALAGLIGVGPGNPVQLPSRLGPQSLIWVSVQARVGTIKRFVEDLGLEPGDPIFLEFSPTGFDVKRLVPRPGSDPIDQIFSLIGQGSEHVDNQHALCTAVAAALFLPEDADADTVVATLRHRKELELAELVSTALTTP
ncbi:sigma factor-like helix-turn-helix DNA-binding protein [Williamsia sp.]|uniref:sigma factor-like helix-turn-helix DNA-binding protein n=1 Tax=Williamsia sp. TaxID=1872085 RepID=UPI002F92D93B